jgi:peptidoglycan/LPS O-acetylase OafA/YrhL
MNAKDEIAQLKKELAEIKGRFPVETPRIDEAAVARWRDEMRTPLSRSWELAVGGLLACFYFKDNPQRSQPVRGYMPAPCDVRATSGLLLLVIAVSFLHRDIPYPGSAALLPTFGALLLISAEGAWFNRHILSARWQHSTNPDRRARGAK